ncbi:nuclear transport factor 2 family protein [Sphingomonas jatrophae]|uniref:SnoaL-like domain-containing protein n=1 Tax=Sphingomonas jatrophae TaxID=1166337 RepID=A0A1I6KC52_9SPHN|nr:nuclear transport factor 2 family protein [Sphingomonas jatrophae]SFR88797.1 SnoaL-like domain-containing protein [Sphingomonas jatrophae]
MNIGKPGMRRFDPETAAIVVELQQMLFDFGHEIDANQGRNITAFYAEDGVWELGDRHLAGDAAIRDFYTDHYARIAREQKDGQRQLLHAFVNVRVSVAEDRRHATLDFFNLNFSAEGARPIEAAPIAPNMIVECRMECRREPDGAWRITRFAGTPQFVGGESVAARLLGRAG